MAFNGVTRVRAAIRGRSNHFLFEPPHVTLLEHSQAWFQRPAQIAYLVHQSPTEPIGRAG